MDSTRIRELDGWRALSVALVIVHHLGTFQHPGLLARAHIPRLAHVVEFCGPLGVKVFFVISGFVICRLLRMEEARYGSVSLKGFYYRRAFRILPPLCFYLGVIALLLGFGLIHESWKAFAEASLFLRDFRIPPSSWLVGHTWSLAVEEQFYLIFPALWILAPRRWKPKVFLIVLAACVAWSLSMIYAGWSGFVYNDTRAGYICICTGVLMAIHEERLRCFASSLLPLTVILTALVLLLHPFPEHSVRGILYEALIEPFGIGLVLLSSLESRPWFRNFLCNPILQTVGLMSYGVYLWQQLFTAPIYYFSGAARVVPMLLPLLCLVVPLSYYFVEKPAMAYGKSLSRRARRERESSVRAAAMA